MEKVLPEWAKIGTSITSASGVCPQNCPNKEAWCDDCPRVNIWRNLPAGVASKIECPQSTGKIFWVRWDAKKHTCQKSPDCQHKKCQYH